MYIYVYSYIYICSYIKGDLKEKRIYILITCKTINLIQDGLLCGCFRIGEQAEKVPCF